jgi:hypothetical protein
VACKKRENLPGYSNMENQSTSNKRVTDRKRDSGRGEEGERERERERCKPVR